jgi:hypothetical protein
VERLQTERIGESQPMRESTPAVGSIDVNRDLATETQTDLLVFGCLGEASAAFHPRLRISTQAQHLNSSVSTPMTPLTMPSGSRVPDHLQIEFLEWVRTRNPGPSNGGFLTPQARKLSALDSARRRQEFLGPRRQDVVEAGRQ